MRCMFLLTWIIINCVIFIDPLETCELSIAVALFLKHSKLQPSMYLGFSVYFYYTNSLKQTLKTHHQQNFSDESLRTCTLPQVLQNECNFLSK